MTPARSPVIRAERVAAGRSKRKSDAPRPPRRRGPQLFTNYNTSMSPSKDTSSHRRKSDPSIDTMGDELPKEICSRVRKACNRCRLRKVKCNGRVPCARCEQDHATCKINYDVTGIKDLRKRYAELLPITDVSMLMVSLQLHCLSRRATDLLTQCPQGPATKNTRQQRCVRYDRAATTEGFRHRSIEIQRSTPSLSEGGESPRKREPQNHTRERTLGTHAIYDGVSSVTPRAISRASRSIRLFVAVQRHYTTTRDPPSSAANAMAVC